MLPQSPPQQHQIQLAGPPHGTPAPVSASPGVSKADAASVGVMAAAVAATAAAAAAAPPAAPSAAVSSATASFVTSAVKGGWFIGDRGTEPGGAPGATVTVIPISLTPQGTTSNNTPAKNERGGVTELQPDCLQQRCSSPRGGEFEGRVVHVKPWCKTACTYWLSGRFGMFRLYGDHAHNSNDNTCFVTHTGRASREEGDGVRGDPQAARGAADPEGQARRQERPIQVSERSNSH